MGSKDLTIAIRDYAALEQQVRLYQADDLSPLTRRLYDDIWQRFTNFLAPAMSPFSIHWSARAAASST